MIRKLYPVVLLLVMVMTLSGCATGQQTDISEEPEGAQEEITTTEESSVTPDVTAQAGESTEKTEESQMSEEMLAEDQIRISIGDNSFIVKLEDNESASALRNLLADGDKTIPASNYGGFEKVCRLGETLPSNDKQTITSAGDVMLYSSDQIVIFYDSNSWAYTRLGKVEGLSAKELEDILSGSETEITISIK